MNLTAYITPRVEAMLLRAVLLATSAATVMLGGCADARTESLNLGDGPSAAYGGRAGAGSEALFDTPEANAVVAYYGREALPEYARLDDRMAIAGETQPRLATSDWPQYPAPDANRVRIIYLPIYTSTSTQAVPVYQRERQWRGRSY
jgi:hypothetical protein